MWLNMTTDITQSKYLDLALGLDRNPSAMKTVQKNDVINSSLM